MVLGNDIRVVVATNRLRGRLGKEHRVMLVDRQDKHYFASSLPWVMAGWRKAGTPVIPLSRLEKKGIEFVQGSVTSIDLDTHKVHTDTAVQDWDYLVIALGTEMEPGAVPGMAETAHGYCTLEGTAKLHEALQTFDGGKIAVGIAEPPYRCPAAPYEGVLLIDYLICKRGLRDRVEISFFTPEPAPLPVAGPEMGEGVKDVSRKREIAAGFGTNLASVDVERKELLFKDGTRQAFDMPVTIPRHRVSAVVSESGLTGETGWIEADRSTLATEASGVYALGDAVFIKLASGLPLPKAGVFASGWAEVIARNIASRIQSGDANARFEGHGSCFLEIDGRKAGMAVGDFYAEPVPQVKFRRPGLIWHMSKVMFKRWWLYRWYWCFAGWGN